MRPNRTHQQSILQRPTRLATVVVLFGALIFIHHLLSSRSSSVPLPSSDTQPPPNRGFNVHSTPLGHRHPSLRPKDNVHVDSRGLTAYDPQDPVHPIERLIERGKRLAKAMQARLDSDEDSLDDAVEDYERAYRMKPPRGFDKWYDFTRQTPPPRSVWLPSLYPLAHDPFLNFLSLPASLIRKRIDASRDKEWSFTLTFVPDGTGDDGTACTPHQTWHKEDWFERGKGRVKVRGPAAWTWRSNNTLTLLLPILPLMPEELFHANPPVEIIFTKGDGPMGMVHNELQERAEALGRAGKVWRKSQLDKAERTMGWTYGWQWACPPDSPLRLQATDHILNYGRSPASGGSETSNVEKSFIADFDLAADFCENPDMANYHHILLNGAYRSAVDLVPAVAACRTARNSDIVGVPLDGAWEEVDFIPWEEKSINKAFWRGSATGMFHNKKDPWRQAQRERLHFLAHNTSEEPLSILIQRPDGVELESDWDRVAVNHAWLDVGLSGGPVQCSYEDGTCKDMADEIDFLGRVRKEDSPKYKFVIDVDGNGWSSRFRRLLAGNNVVLKSTLYTEWFHEQLIPWYHYVPLKLDYSDLYDILAFFMGAPDGSTKGRDDLAKEIAYNGYNFVETKFRECDMQSFMFLLILEWWRMMSDDREQAAFVL